MSNILDCVVLELEGGPKLQHLATDQNKYDQSNPNIYMHANGRLCIHNLNSYRLDINDVNALSNLALFFKRYDACLLPINQTNLAWARQALHIARNSLKTPVFGLIDSLSVPATNDLIRSGMADFLYNPLSVDELRIRIGRQKQQGIKKAERGVISSSNYSQNNMKINNLNNDNVCESNKSYTIDHVPLVTEAEIQALAYASAVRSAKDNHAFGVAKSRLIGYFERAYIIATLSKTAGNISLAAKGAQKHRRAYWALMRKYDIDAKPFRTNCK